MTTNGKLTDLGTLTVEEICELVYGHDKSKNLALVGDSQTLEKFLIFRDNASKARCENSTATTYDLCGDHVDVGRYLSGEPECMVNYFGYESAKFIDVDIMVGRPWFTPDEIVFEYYLQVLDLIDRLEQEGTRCRITISTHNRNYGSLERKVTMPYKAYGEPLNMAQMAGILLNNKFYTDVIIDAVGIASYPNIDYRGRAPYELSQTDDRITIPSLYYFLGSSGESIFQGWTKRWSGNGSFYPKFERDFVYQQWGLTHLIAE